MGRNDLLIRTFPKYIEPSSRGELEITTVNEVYLKNDSLNVELLGRGFAWLDTGTHDSLIEAGSFVETVQKRQGMMVACLEEIAWRNGWLSKENLYERGQLLSKNHYGQYLLKLVG